MRTLIAVIVLAVSAQAIRLRRAVSFASFGKLRFKTEFEQDLWSECSRLIANCIIFYNASILSRLLEHQERAGDMQGAETTKNVSPNAWQNVNLHGRYEFLKQVTPLNVDIIIRELTEIPIKPELSARSRSRGDIRLPIERDRLNRAGRQAPQRSRPPGFRR